MSMQEPNLGGQQQGTPAPATPPQGGQQTTPPPAQQTTPPQGGQPNATPPATPPTPPQQQQQPPAAPPQEPNVVHTGLPPIQQTENQQVVDNYLTQAGLTTDHVTAELEHGGKISDVTRQLLIAKHGDNAALVEQVIMANYQQQQIMETQAQTAAHNFVAEQFGVEADKGGQALSELVTWAATNIDKERMNQYADLIEAGGLQGELALQSLVNEYKSKANVQPNTITGDVGNVGGGTPLTREEYNKQRFEIEEKHGYNSPQMVELQNRRNAAIAAGY